MRVCATVPQVQRLTEALRRTAWFILPESFEGMHREWKFEGRSVRPASQMVGHTGFITIARHASTQMNAEEAPIEGTR